MLNLKSKFGRLGNKQQGFSLIELVAVIVILGVLATATTQYIIFGTEVYVSSNLRQQTLSESRFLVERMTRELRGAVPNSVRIDSDDDTTPTKTCIEFVPIKASGAYRTDASAVLAPISPNAAGAAIDVISWDTNEYDQGDRLYIYAIVESDVYGTSTRSELIDTITADALDTTSSQYQVGFSGAVLYPEESPIQRYFTADHSVSYCLINNSTTELRDVYRFEHTGFSSVQPLPLSSEGVLMAEGLTNILSSEQPFEFTTGVLTQNSVVSLYLEFEADEGENMFYNHEVHIPNVP